MLADFWLLHKLGVSSFVENEGMWRNEDLKTVGQVLDQLLLRGLLLGDQEELNCFFGDVHNNIIKPWNEMWALGNGSKDGFPQLKLMR